MERCFFQKVSVQSFPLIKQSWQRFTVTKEAWRCRQPFDCFKMAHFNTVVGTIQHTPDCTSWHLMKRSNFQTCTYNPWDSKGQHRLVTVQIGEDRLEGFPQVSFLTERQCSFFQSSSFVTEVAVNYKCRLQHLWCCGVREDSSCLFKKNLCPVFPLSV